MPLVSSGEISIGGSTTDRSINLELGLSATATSSLNDAALRTLAGVASGAISLSNFYGKSNAPTFSPDGGTSSGSRVTLSDYRAAGTASVTITCSQTATWTYTRVSGTAGSANVASGGTGTTITFSMAKGVNYRYSEWTLDVTASGVTRYYRIILETEGNQ
jgi:hypothetical protein